MNTPARITILNAALTELRDLHTEAPQCPGAAHCPTAKAINDLESVIAEMTMESAREATYPPMKVEDVPDPMADPPKWFVANLEWLKSWIDDATIEGEDSHGAQWFLSSYHLYPGSSSANYSKAKAECIQGLTDRHVKDMIIALVFGSERRVVRDDYPDAVYIGGFLEKYGRLPERTDKVRVKIHHQHPLGAPYESDEIGGIEFRYYSALNSIELLPSETDVANAVLTAQGGLGQ